MYREEQFLKYLDNELPPGGMAEVEKILASDPEARQQMETLKADRESLLSVLDGLNPIDDVNIPAFRPCASSTISDTTPEAAESCPAPGPQNRSSPARSLETYIEKQHQNR